MSECIFCERAGQPLRPCCHLHPQDMVCADAAGCRDYLLHLLAIPAAVQA